MPHHSKSSTQRVLQSLKTFSVDIDQALHTNLLSPDEVEEIGSALVVVQAKLNTHKNLYAPINKLPPEILGRIFQFAIVPGPEFFENRYQVPPSTPPPQATWYENLMLVCTRWRTVALACPRMWYYIVDDGMPDQGFFTWGRRYNARVVLQRSGRTTPLHLYMTVSPLPESESVPQWVIKNQPLRVEALHLTVRDGAQRGNDALLESLATPFPSLRLLTVDAIHDPFTPGSGPDMPIILGGETPNLEALIWSSGIMSLPGNTFPNLAHLSLYDVDGGLHDIRNLNRLLRLLSNCPRLQTLVFSQTALDAVDDIEPGRGPVTLNHLRVLWIDGDYLPVEDALTFLSYLELPANATVRLSNIYDCNIGNNAQMEELPVPFLAQIDGPTRLDIIHCAGGYNDEGDAFHFIVVGPRARFWIHMPGASTAVALCHLTFLYKMLPKEGIETIRISVLSMPDFAFLPSLLSAHLPSLNTLLIRHSKVAGQNAALVGINALARALCPDRDPTDDTDLGGSSDDHNEDEEDTDSGWESADDSEQGDHLLDHSSGGAPAASHHDNYIDINAGFPAEESGSGGVPAPQLKVVGLELKRQGAPLAPLKPFARAIAERKRRGHPLATVRCALMGVDKRDVEDMFGEHVVDGVSDVGGKLWVPEVDEGWMAKNDYWRLYPSGPGNEVNFPRWGFYMEEW